MFFFFFKQKTAYEMRISDWSSDVCSSDLSTDMIGAEIGGAVKNILAIACGIVDGAGLGLNARAAPIGRGFAEMTRFRPARGAPAGTPAGLAAVRAHNGRRSWQVRLGSDVERVVGASANIEKKNTRT